MKKILLLICVAAALVLCTALASAELPIMQMHQINIGCGDAYMITDGTTTFLIDCGTDTDIGIAASNEGLLSYLAHSGIRHIDAHFVTHYHNDHAMNIKVLSSLYGTGDTVVYGPTTQLPEVYRDLPNGTYRQLVTGEEMDLGNFHILCTGPYEVRHEGNANEDSLNLFITYGEKTFYISGDRLNWRLKEMFPEITHCDVLKFPHHGLATVRSNGDVIYSMTGDNMRQLNPDIILIPATYNFGVANWAKACGVPQPEVYSGGDGHIVILCDGKSLQVYDHVEEGQFVDNPGVVVFSH